MTRRLLILAVFLLAGAVVNVGVAWGCVAHVAKQMGSEQDDPEQQVGIWPPNTAYWEVERRTYEGYTLLTSAQPSGSIWRSEDFYVPPYRPTREWLPMWARCRKIHPDVSESYDGVLVENAAGWPFLAVRSSHRWRSPITSATIRTDQLSGVLRPSWLRLSDDAALPCLPIWPGFAANTVCYATILAVLCYSPFALRRFIRHRRGLCMRCGYPMGESAVCSECGKALPERTEAAP